MNRFVLSSVLATASAAVPLAAHAGTPCDNEAPVGGYVQPGPAPSAVQSYAAPTTYVQPYAAPTTYVQPYAAPTYVQPVAARVYAPPVVQTVAARRVVVRPGFYAGRVERARLRASVGYGYGYGWGARHARRW